MSSLWCLNRSCWNTDGTTCLGWKAFVPLAVIQSRAIQTLIFLPEITGAHHIFTTAFSKPKPSYDYDSQQLPAEASGRSDCMSSPSKYPWWHLVSPLDDIDSNNHRMSRDTPPHKASILQLLQGVSAITKSTSNLNIRFKFKQELHIDLHWEEKKST